MVATRTLTDSATETLTDSDILRIWKDLPNAPYVKNGNDAPALAAPWNGFGAGTLRKDMSLALAGKYSGGMALFSIPQVEKGEEAEVTGKHAVVPPAQPTAGEAGSADMQEEAKSGRAADVTVMIDPIGAEKGSPAEAPGIPVAETIARKSKLAANAASPGADEPATQADAASRFEQEMRASESRDEARVLQSYQRARSKFAEAPGIRRDATRGELDAAQGSAAERDGAASGNSVADAGMEYGAARDREAQIREKTISDSQKLAKVNQELNERLSATQMALNTQREKDAGEIEQLKKRLEKAMEQRAAENDGMARGIIAALASSVGISPATGTVEELADAITSNVEAKAREVESLIQENEAIRAERDSALTAATAQKAKATRYEAQFEIAQNRVSELQEENNALVGQNSALVREANELQDVINGHNAIVRTVQQEAENHKSQAEKFERLYGEAVESLGESRERIAELESRNTALILSAERCGELEQENQKMKVVFGNEFIRHDDEKRGYGAELEAMRSRVERAEAEVALYQAERVSVDEMWEKKQAALDMAFTERANIQTIEAITTLCSELGVKPPKIELGDTDMLAKVAEAIREANIAAIDSARDIGYSEAIEMMKSMGYDTYVTEMENFVDGASIENNVDLLLSPEYSQPVEAQWDSIAQEGPTYAAQAPAEPLQAPVGPPQATERAKAPESAVSGAEKRPSNIDERKLAGDADGASAKDGDSPARGFVSPSRMIHGRNPMGRQR